MATSFKREHKERTTEPSDNEVKMKRGGHAHKKHMAMGGNAMMANPRITGAVAPALAAQMAAQQGRASLMQPRGIARPAPGIPVMPATKKKGGEVESKAMEAKEEREIKGIKKELKHHEHEKASKAHHGLKKGGMAKPSALLGGIEATRADKKRESGTIEGPGYKRGGGVAAEANTKVVGAKMRKSISSKTAGVEGKGYAKGGSVKPYEETEMHGGPKMPTKKAGTGEIKQDPAGYKKGGHVKHTAHHKHAEHHATSGHVAHHKQHHAEGGHVHMHEKITKLHEGGHEKIKAHPMKKGGKACNY